MNYVSVCSGIEAATIAWHPLGWEPLLFAEVARFPSAVLAHHYPEVPNAGDFTTIVPPHSTCDLLVGGTPCQAFSVAGLRGGLADARGNLALEFCRLADRLRSRWVIWENVPGVLSSDGGRAFGSVLGALVELGYGFAYRVLDAQFFGVPQRRRRVFLVGHLGDWRRAAAVLFERESLRRDPAPSGGTRAEVARDAAVSVGGSRAHCIAFDPTQITHRENRSRPPAGKPCPTLARTAHHPAIAFHHQQDPVNGEVSPALSRGANGMGIARCLTHHHGRNAGEDTFVPVGYRVRRLTPRECERLQGFPDDYTAIPGASDSARYEALGNSMAVPVMRWIGRRISFVDGVV